MRAPSTNTSPTPIIAAATWASGARSPDAPTEPWSGTTGTSPRASIASSSATVSGCTPDAPCARLASFRASISRATGTGIGVAPPPAGGPPPVSAACPPSNRNRWQRRLSMPQVRCDNAETMRLAASAVAVTSPSQKCNLCPG